MISETNLKSGLKIRCSKSCKENVALLCRAFKQSPDNEAMRADATQYTLLIIFALNSFFYKHPISLMDSIVLVDGLELLAIL